MDPNECLRELLELSTANCDDPALILFESLERAGELFSSLDQWLSRDGFLPTLWRVEPADEVLSNSTRALAVSNSGYALLIKVAVNFVATEGCCPSRQGVQFFRAFLKFHGLLIGGAPLPTPWKREVPL